jgi:hypothetical protein
MNCVLWGNRFGTFRVDSIPQIPDYFVQINAFFFTVKAIRRIFMLS